MAVNKERLSTVEEAPGWKSDQSRWEKRIMGALLHPNCPILCMDYEAREMSKHIAEHITRLSAKLKGAAYDDE